MSWLDDIQKFGKHIEDNLDTDVTVDEMISSLNISKFHFYRLFKAVIGLSIHEYVKRRKLQAAAQMLKDTDRSVLDVAINYGFNSQEVFSRNFRKYFEESPGKWRHSGLLNKSLSKFDIEAIKLDIKTYNGAVDVKEHLEEMPVSYFIGTVYDSDDDQVSTIEKKIESFIEKSHTINNVVDEAIYRICYEPDFESQPVSFKEFIGVKVDDYSELSKDMYLLSLPPSKFIKYVHRGPLFKVENDQILSTYDFIYRYRLSMSGHQLKQDYYIERYGEKFYGPYHDESELEIYLSIE